jgi:hypothetical protein
MISRRSILAAIPAAAVIGCAGVTTATLASDAQLVLAGAQSLGDAVMAIANVPAATVSQVNSDIATVTQGCQAIAAGTANDSTVVPEVVDAIKAVVPIVLPLLPNGSALVPVANALLAMVPALLAYVGVSGAAVGVVPVYTPDQARLILRAAH